ncbi:3'(2'),5'-bisphosphate nucleotidase CysQ [Novosphingobium mangrovi (ex Huang et al. 2023)]|uniref:3'(2'),5'-bisphosphate nucleotidase CysQ n=1 Tax=Novosphingobium mangrovi (ex Huang et al. 2023) TaxID=2976432 RepID=A0ABT2IA30_9SPHN|nr:3'(2'),5'-bisphosphate nucleotidase CysQ [Novosphingobium mangrovi (ex Huang et al. 2023)]MCT2401629.1 3'(2'),5'-bisphosphate nucleotidase CysQ [Novosphingobium mangrovi (ex Huang et al. 2023)]
MIDRDRLEAIVREAGRIALAGWPGDGHELDHWEKSPGNPVCAVDLEVDSFLKKELHALLPAAGWLSEETVDAPSRLSDTLVWLVDPVDGTRDFIGGRTGWAVSVALVNTRRPLFGYLYAPARRREDGGEFWFGEAGKGAWRNGERLVASRRESLSGARVPARKLAPEDADLEMVYQPNSIALRMAMVAADEADLLATLRWGYEWDVAAAGLIAREAGAAVTDAFGKPLNYNKHDPRAFGVLCSSNGIHDAAVKRLAERAARFSV